MLDFQPSCYYVFDSISYNTYYGSEKVSEIESKEDYVKKNLLFVYKNRINVVTSLIWRRYNTY